MGGMAAQIPDKRDAQASKNAMEQVAKINSAKFRWVTMAQVAHPALVSVTRSAFDENMQGPNQIAPPLSPVKIVQHDLLIIPDCMFRDKGVEIIVDVSSRYMASWLGGTGCVPIYDVMEDAATAEISRSHLWQWIRNGARMTDGTTVDLELVKNMVATFFDRIRAEIGKEAFKRSQPRPKNREFSRDIRELKFAVTGSSNESLITVLVMLSRKGRSIRSDCERSQFEDLGCGSCFER